jgi:hypothetical protein
VYKIVIPRFIVWELRGEGWGNVRIRVKHFVLVHGGTNSTVIRIEKLLCKLLKQHVVSSNIHDRWSSVSNNKSECEISCSLCSCHCNDFLRELIAQRSVSKSDTDESDISVNENGSVMEVITGAQVQNKVSRFS